MFRVLVRENVHVLYCSQTIRNPMSYVSSRNSVLFIKVVPLRLYLDRECLRIMEIANRSERTFSMRWEAFEHLRGGDA